MGREFELKYRSDKKTIAAIRARYGDFVSIRMETTYYDTPDGALNRLRWTLRQRFEDDVSVCTVKTPGRDGSRGEWELECRDILEAIPELCKLGAPKELEELVSGGVVTRCGARFVRLAKTVEAEGCVLELALDEGVLIGGGKTEDLAEVEVELKDGSEIAAIALAHALAAEFGMVPEYRSKVQRAMALVLESEEREHGI